MALPELPEGQPRLFLQAVWDLASERLRWPTFAELDRRWDAGHDSDVTDIMRQLPVGYITGFSSSMLPQASTAIGLTVAGVAACKDTQEVLAIFLDFLRVASASEREWNPSTDDPDARPSLGDRDYERQAHGLPAAGRSDLLQLLFQLLKTEQCGWTGLGGPDGDGHWTVTLGRGIRLFRGVTDLDDYWSRRHKSWERDPAGPEAVPGQPRPVAGDREAVLLEKYPDVLASALLTWIYARAGGRTTEIVACSDFRPTVSPAKTEEALRRLESQDQVRLHWIEPAPALPRAQLTAAGAEQAEQSQRAWHDSVARDRAARNALLAWMRDQRDSPQGAALVTNFLQDRRSTADGRFFSAADVDAAAAYLYDKGLIDGTFADQQRGPVFARLKADGIDCIEHGGDVAAYLAGSHVAGTTYNFNAPVTGTNVAVGDGATQVSVTQGIDADSLRTLMQAICEALPALRLGAPQQADAESTAGEILAEARQTSPDPSRLQRALGGLRRSLASSAQQALAAVLSAVIDHELARIGLPPGG